MQENETDTPSGNLAPPDSQSAPVEAEAEPAATSETRLPEAAASEPSVAQPVEAERAPVHPSWRSRHPWVFRTGLAIAVLIGLVFGSLILFRFVNPPITSVMIVEKLRGETLKRKWVPFNKISPHMRLAVIASEDGNFCKHSGVDWQAVREVIESAKNFEPARGASTIPMQVVKNIYLWEFRSYLRKALEVPLSYALVSLWPKDRILEVYLNIAQFGPGLFGVEAASQRYFRKPASALTQREALLLAATLPKPLVRNPARPSRTHRIVADAVRKRLPYIAKRAGCITNL